MTMVESFASVVYLVRSAANSAAWIPCMLSLDQQHVELVSQRGIELSCGPSDLTVEVTGLSYLRFVAGEETFVLSGFGGRAVPLPLPSLIRRLKSFNAEHPASPKVSLIDPVTQWQRLLVAAGARPQGRRRSLLRLLWGVSVCTLVAGFGCLGALIAWVAAR